jgi:hypothetical protein
VLSLWVERVDHDLLGAFNFGSAEWAAVSVGVLLS